MKWEDCKGITIPRTKFSSVHLEKDNLIYVLGGKEGDGNRTANIEIFNYMKGSWEQGPKMPKPRSGFAAVSYKNERVYIMGGNDGRVQNRCDYFSVST